MKDLAIVTTTYAVLPASPLNLTPRKKRAMIEATLRECKWNKASAAQRLGISYKTLLNEIHAYGLD